MANQPMDAAGVAMLILAAPAWALLILAVPNSIGFRGSPDRYVIAPIVLIGMTAAIRRLFRRRTNAWPAAAFLAGYGIVLFLLLLLFLA